MPNKAPMARPHKGDGPLSERRANGVINARRDDPKIRILKRRIERSERRAKWGGLAVVIGVAFEVALAFASSEPLLLKIAIGLANGLVTLGVAAEVFFGRRGATAQAELQRRAEVDLAESLRLASEATDRATKADLDRIELEKKLWPRMLNQEQWDFVQGLKSELPRIAIAYETDAETRWYAGTIRDAFWAAGISVATYPRAGDVHSFGTLVYEPKGLFGARPITVEPLVKLMGMTELVGSLGVITEVPADILEARSKMRAELCAPLDTPMLILGGRFILPPPHLERLAKAAKAQRDAISASQTKPDK